MHTQSNAGHWTQECDQEESLGYTKINSCTDMLNVTKIIATPMHSNKFTDFDMKKYKF